MAGTSLVLAAALLLASFLTANAGPAASYPDPHVAQPEPPSAVDGMFEDWTDVEPAWQDATGDGDRIDLGRVWVRSDAERVTFRFEVGTDMSLQGGNELTLYVDGDGDADTGHSVAGIGAEFSWTFGKRGGTLWGDEGGEKVEQNAVGLLQAPTVSSTQFEVSFMRWSPDLGSIIPGPDAAFVLVDEGSRAGDRLPDDGCVRLELSGDPPKSGPPATLERRDPDDIRILTYNVLFDGLFKRPAAFVRILRAIDPDVICFQEIWSHTARQAADQVSLALPGETWYGAHTTEGQVVSRYPFLEAGAIDEAGNYWVLVDLPDDRYDADMSVVSAHPPCCDKEVERQEQLDGIAAWLRELMTAGGSELPPGTPSVVAGDMNLVGGSRQVRTLLEGAIVYEETFGPSHSPDWDGTPLADANPRHAGGAANFTWRDARGSFAPGKLDYIVYSDSVLELGNAFVLATEELAPDVLARYGLRVGDTLEASDHLPVVADFTPVGAPARTEPAE